MAAYLTECQGSRGAVSRLGGAIGGVTALCKSWTHALHIRMSEKDGKDFITIRIHRINDSGDLGYWQGTPEELGAILSSKKKARKT